MNPLPPLRTVTAVYPGPTQPRRGHFIERLHHDLEDRFHSEILAPRVFSADPLEESGAPSVTRFPYRSGDRLPKAGGIGPWGLLSYVRGALAAARKRWPDGDGERGGLVLAHWVVPTGWIAARVARRLGVPLVLYGHGSDLNHYAQTTGLRGVVRRLLREADVTVVASRALAEIAQDLSGRPIDDFPVISVGIDERFLAPAPAPAAPEPWRLLFVGDLIVGKGFDHVLSATEQLTRSGHRVELHVHGTGPLAEGLQCREHVHHHGASSADEVRAALDACHYLLLPSLQEGTPLVVQEALAVGRPVIATRVGGIPDLFADRSGYVPLESVAELPEVLIREFRAGPDAHARRVADMAANETDTLSHRETARRLGDVLDGVLP